MSSGKSTLVIRQVNTDSTPVFHLSSFCGPVISKSPGRAKQNCGRQSPDPGPKIHGQMLRYFKCALRSFQEPRNLQAVALQAITWCSLLIPKKLIHRIPDVEICLEAHKWSQRSIPSCFTLDNYNNHRLTLKNEAKGSYVMRKINHLQFVSCRVAY